MKNKPIAITGIGVISNLGFNPNDFWLNRKKENKAQEVDIFNTASRKAKKAYQISDFTPKKFINRRIIKPLDQVTRYCISGVGLAIEDSCSDIDKSQTALFVGSKYHGIQSIFNVKESYFDNDIEGVSPVFFPGTVFNASGGQAAIEWKITGPNCVVNAGMASGICSIIKGADYLKVNRIKLAVAGGNEMLHPFIYSKYDELNLLSYGVNGDEQLKPFDKNANGTILGEGAAYFALEEVEQAKERNARVYAEIISYNQVFANKITKSEIVELIQKTRNVNNDEETKIDLVVCDGSGNKEWDELQAAAIQECFQSEPYVTSNKESIGHTLGASGAFNVLEAVLSITNNEIAPIFKLQEPAVHLNYVDKVTSADIQKAMVLSFDPAGNLACMIIKKPE